MTRVSGNAAAASSLVPPALFPPALLALGRVPKAGEQSRCREFGQERTHGGPVRGGGLPPCASLSPSQGGASAPHGADPPARVRVCPVITFSVSSSGGAERVVMRGPELRWCVSPFLHMQSPLA